jgi:hypothetical protein
METPQVKITGDFFAREIKKQPVDGTRTRNSTPGVRVDCCLLSAEPYSTTIDQTCMFECSRYRSKDRKGPASGLMWRGNSFTLNKLAERVGFEFARKRSFNNMERTTGTVKQLGDDGKQR